MTEPTIINFTGTDDNGALYQGSAFEAIVTVRGADGKPVNLSSYKVRSQARKTPSDSTPAWTFDTSLVDVTEDGTTYTKGAIRLFLGATASSTLTPAIYGYDVELELLTDAEIVVKPCAGKIRVKAEVTR